MSKPTEAASDGRGATEPVLQFPALVTAPVKNIRWRGRYPRGVSSLACARRMRDAKALAKAYEEANQPIDMATAHERFAAVLLEKAKQIREGLED